MDLYSVGAEDFDTPEEGDDRLLANGAQENDYNDLVGKNDLVADGAPMSPLLQHVNDLAQFASRASGKHQLMCLDVGLSSQGFFLLPSLPQEMIIAIVRELRPFPDICSLALTCKQWLDTLHRMKVWTGFKIINPPASYFSIKIPAVWEVDDSRDVRMLRTLVLASPYHPVVGQRMTALQHLPELLIDVNILETSKRTETNSQDLLGKVLTKLLKKRKEQGKMRITHSWCNILGSAKSGFELRWCEKYGRTGTAEASKLITFINIVTMNQNIMYHIRFADPWEDENTMLRKVVLKSFTVRDHLGEGRFPVNLSPFHVNVFGQNLRFGIPQGWAAHRQGMIGESRLTTSKGPWHVSIVTRLKDLRKPALLEVANHLQNQIQVLDQHQPTGIESIKDALAQIGIGKNKKAETRKNLAEHEKWCRNLAEVPHGDQELRELYLKYYIDVSLQSGNWKMHKQEDDIVVDFRIWDHQAREWKLSPTTWSMVSFLKGNSAKLGPCNFSCVTVIDGTLFRLEFVLQGPPLSTIPSEEYYFGCHHLMRSVTRAIINSFCLSSEEGFFAFDIGRLRFMYHSTWKFSLVENAKNLPWICCQFIQPNAQIKITVRHQQKMFYGGALAWIASVYFINDVNVERTETRKICGRNMLVLTTKYTEKGGNVFLGKYYFLELDGDTYVIKIHALSSTPEDKLQEAEEIVQSLKIFDQEAHNEFVYL